MEIPVFCCVCHESLSPMKARFHCFCCIFRIWLGINVLIGCGPKLPLIKMVNAVFKMSMKTFCSTDFYWKLLRFPPDSGFLKVRMHLHWMRFKRASLDFGTFRESFAIKNYECVNPVLCVTKSKVINLDELLTGIRPVQAIIFEQIEMNDLCVNEFVGLWREKTHLFKTEIYSWWATAKEKTRTRSTHTQHAHTEAGSEKNTRGAQKSQIIKWWPRGGWRGRWRRRGGMWNGNQTENSIETWHSPNKMANWCGRSNLYNSVFSLNSEHRDVEHFIFVISCFFHNRFSSRAHLFFGSLSRHIISPENECDPDDI